MRRLAVTILSMMVFVSCFCSLIFAQADETITFNEAIVEKTITSILHTGEDLCLPRITAKQGDQDVTNQISVNVYNAENQKVNADGSFIAENLTAGTYTVYYSVGEIKSTKEYTVTVSDDAISAVLDEDRRPSPNAYREVAYRVRAITVEEGASVTIYLYDSEGNEVYSEEQKNTRQISLTPSALGYNTVTYKVTKDDKTVLCSFPVYVDIKDYEGDFFGYSFEGDDWIDAYGIGVWCNTSNNDDAFTASISKEESRSGAASLKFDVVSLAYQPTIYFRLDFSPDRLMRKDDATEYVIRFYVKKGEDFYYDDLLPVVDFHALAKKTTTDSHYGAYKWSLGNFLIKQEGEDGWALVEYTFTSYSDEYVFSQDWLTSAPNYSNYGGMQFVIVPTNYTGTIYIDDVQLFKKGVQVEDLLESNPHDDGFNYDNSEESSGVSDENTSNGLLIGLSIGGVVVIAGVVFVIIFVKKKSKESN